MSCSKLGGVSSSCVRSLSHFLLSQKMWSLTPFDSVELSVELRVKLVSQLRACGMDK